MAVIRLQCCRRCKHSEPVQGSAELECRRYPPSVSAMPIPVSGGKYTIHMQTAFPRINPDLFCGEWGPKFAASVEPTMLDPARFGEMALAA